MFLLKCSFHEVFKSTSIMEGYTQVMYN